MAETIQVKALARVEGEGGLTIRYKGNEVRSVELRIFEPPRFFEAFLRGRGQGEVPDITARICGICPVAYQMSSCQALENAHGLKQTTAIQKLRRLLYCGEWIESHALHIFLLHAPDFFGKADAIQLAREHPEVVKIGLRLKKLGNTILEKVGGRAVHPINVKLGGFHRAPTKAELDSLVPELAWAKSVMGDVLTWVSKLNFPDFERDYEFVALQHPDEYAIESGRIVSNRGIDIDVNDYEKHFEEIHVEHSTALQSRIKGRGEYFCGPLARYNHNFEALGDAIKGAAAAAHIEPPVKNPFKSIIVRAVELLFAFDEAARLIASYEGCEPASLAVPQGSGNGAGCTEAPRGILWHRYEVENGLVKSARIVPPTSQNQACIEGDLRLVGARLVDLPHEDATRLAEQTVRNYDPCISCATHFLKLERVREP